MCQTLKISTKPSFGRAPGILFSNQTPVHRHGNNKAKGCYRIQLANRPLWPSAYLGLTVTPVTYPVVRSWVMQVFSPEWNFGICPTEHLGFKTKKVRIPLKCALVDRTKQEAVSLAVVEANRRKSIQLYATHSHTQ